MTTIQQDLFHDQHIERVNPSISHMYEMLKIAQRKESQVSKGIGDLIKVREYHSQNVKLWKEKISYELNLLEKAN